jgi:hypothetical protein
MNRSRRFGPEETPALAQPPVIALDRAGNGHVAWVETDDVGGARLFAARFLQEAAAFAPAVALSGTTPVAPTPTLGRTDNPGLNPRISVDPQGRAIAVWVGPAGGVWAARFE